MNRRISYGILVMVSICAVGLFGLAAQVGFAQQGAAMPSPQMAENVAGYHVATTVPLPDAGFWDYLGIDEANHHLFVSHSDEILEAVS